MGNLYASLFIQLHHSWACDNINCFCVFWICMETENFHGNEEKKLKIGVNWHNLHSEMSNEVYFYTGTEIIPANVSFYFTNIPSRLLWFDIVIVHSPDNSLITRQQAFVHLSSETLFHQHICVCSRLCFVL